MRHRTFQWQHHQFSIETREQQRGPRGIIPYLNCDDAARRERVQLAVAKIARLGFDLIKRPQHLSARVVDGGVAGVSSERLHPALDQCVTLCGHAVGV